MHKTRSHRLAETGEAAKENKPMRWVLYRYC